MLFHINQTTNNTTIATSDSTTSGPPVVGTLLKVSGVVPQDFEKLKRVHSLYVNGTGFNASTPLPSSLRQSGAWVVQDLG